MSRWSPGEQVANRFVIEGWLASGGMAEVYVAEMELARGVKKRVALKRIHTHLAEDQHFLTMFIDEARLASQLSQLHPIVPQPFFVNHMRHNPMRAIKTLAELVREVPR